MDLLRTAATLFFCVLIGTIAEQHEDAPPSHGNNSVGNPDCENTFFTDQQHPRIRSEIRCQGQVFHRSPAFLAAYECCAGRKQNAHCRMVCHMEAIKLLRADGTWNTREVIQLMLKDFGSSDFAYELAADSLHCIRKYGNYVRSTSCHGIEKHLACFRDITLRTCRATTNQFFNTNSLETASLKCRGTKHYMPALVMEKAGKCQDAVNSTYLMTMCLWRELEILNPDHSFNHDGLFHWATLIFGRKQGIRVLKSVMPILNTFQLEKDANEENAIHVMSEFFANIKEGYFRACGEITNDLLNTL